MTIETRDVGIGHCGKYCPNWVCNEEPKWDDLCVGCPCNPEDDEFWEDEYYEDEHLEDEE